MTNLNLSNKRMQYTAKAEAANVRIEGEATVSEANKVVEFNGSVFTKSDTPVWVGNYNFNERNASVTLGASKEHLSEASQLIMDTVAGIEAALAPIK